METTTVPLEAPSTRESRRRWFGLPAAIRRARRALSASEPHVRTVWVVSFTPYRDRASIGGFDWRTDWAAADALYTQAVTDSVECGGCHVVRLVPYRSDREGDALTEEIDSRLDLIEGGELAAAREFVPGAIDRGFRVR